VHVYSVCSAVQPVLTVDCLMLLSVHVLPLSAALNSACSYGKQTWSSTTLVFVVICWHSLCTEVADWWILLQKYCSLVQVWPVNLLLRRQFVKWGLFKCLSVSSQVLSWFKPLEWRAVGTCFVWTNSAVSGVKNWVIILVYSCCSHWQLQRLIFVIVFSQSVYVTVTGYTVYSSDHSRRYACWFIYRC